MGGKMPSMVEKPPVFLDAALTWEGAQPQQAPQVAASAVQLLVEPPSAIHVLAENAAVLFMTLELAKRYNLRARRIHDARHAATALIAGVQNVYTYDVEDWRHFAPEGLKITGPYSVV